MYDKEDFFSPEIVDERLDLSLLQRESDASYQDMAEGDPNLRLISDLRYLYGTEGTEHVRSLQRVWEHLQGGRVAEQTASEPILVGPDLPEDSGPPSAQLSASEARPARHLRLLKPTEQSPDQQHRKSSGDGLRISRRFKPALALNRPLTSSYQRLYGRGLAALAAVLFLCVMVGSLLTVVRLTNGAQAAQGTPTATVAQTTPEPTLEPGYPYAPPGQTLAVSPPSLLAFAALAWSPDSERIATSAGNKIWLWNISDHSYRQLATVPEMVEGGAPLDWSPDGHLLAVGSNPIELLDPLKGKAVGIISADYPLSPVAGQTTRVTALAWSPDGRMLAVAAHRPGAPSWVFIWNLRAGTGTYTFNAQGSASAITSLSWSGDNRYVASTDAQSVMAWDIRNGYIVFQHTLTAATGVAWSPEGRYLAFVNQRLTQIWDVWQGEKKQGQLVSSYPAANGVLSWAPHGQYLATASENSVVLLNARSGARIYTYTGDTRYVSALAWSPNGHSLASGESGSPDASFSARVWTA